MNIVNVSNQSTSLREELKSSIESFKKAVASSMNEGLVIGETQMKLEQGEVVFWFDIEKEILSPGTRKIRLLIGEDGKVKIEDCFISKTNFEATAYHPVDGYALENSPLKEVLSTMKTWQHSKTFSEHTLPVCLDWAVQEN